MTSKSYVRKHCQLFAMYRTNISYVQDRTNLAYLLEKRHFCCSADAFEQLAAVITLRRDRSEGARSAETRR